MEKYSDPADMFEMWPQVKKVTELQKGQYEFFPVQSTNLNPWKNVDFDNQLLSPED